MRKGLITIALAVLSAALAGMSVYAFDHAATAMGEDSAVILAALCVGCVIVLADRLR